MQQYWLEFSLCFSCSIWGSGGPGGPEGSGGPGGRGKFKFQFKDKNILYLINKLKSPMTISKLNSLPKDQSDDFIVLSFVKCRTAGK